MEKTVFTYGLLLVACCAFHSTVAQPSYQSSLVVSGHKLYQDAKNPNVYYFLPPDYIFVNDPDGKPSFSLTQMRYTGSSTTGDAGVSKYNNLLQFRVAANPEFRKQFTRTRDVLRAMKPSAELKVMPVKKFNSLLVFASSMNSAPVGDSAVRRIDQANMTEEQADMNNQYWSERIISLRLSDEDAQLVTDALDRHQSIMSFSYAMFTTFSERKNFAPEIQASGHFRPEIAKMLSDGNGQDSLTISLVRADALEINPDIKKWPQLVKKVDINERVPARYPLFDVYCYDFAQGLRSDLFQKKIEITASSVNGNAINTDVIFRESKPDLYAVSVRFPYAIRLDRPFLYRITEVDHNGAVLQTAWIERKEWNGMLDITSPPEKHVKSTSQNDQ